MNCDISKHIDISRKNTKFVEIKISNNIIKIPDWFSMNAEINYVDSYKKDKDYRKAFCILILTMINKNNSEENKNIKIEHIELLPDTDLIKVMKLYLKNNKNLDEYFKKYFKKNYFEAFYLAVKEHEKDIVKHVSNSIGILKQSINNSFKPLTNSIKNMQLSTFNQNETTDNINKIQNSRIPNCLFLNSPEVTTNKLLSNLNNNIEIQNKNQNEYQMKNNDNMVKMIEILSEEQELREKLEIETQKVNKKNFRINIITMAIGVLTLFATILGIILK